VDPDQALAAVIAAAPRGPVEDRPRDACRALVLAEPVLAREDQPPFVRVMMDGFAVRLADAGQAPRVVGEVAAGDARVTPLGDGTALAVMTGAPCPPGTEAVVKLEDTRAEGDRVRLPAAIDPGQHLQPAGALVRAGAEVIPAGAPLTPLALAAAAVTGHDRLRVHRPPRVAIVTTGSELAALGAEPGAAQIRNSNGPMLFALAAELGAEPTMDHANDTHPDLAAALARSAAADLVVLTGGVSRGRYDLVPDAVAAAGYDVHFHGVRQQPGKPILFATRPGQLLFGLPGTPLGCHHGFHRYVAAAIRQHLGRSPRPVTVRGRLTAPLDNPGERWLFRLVGTAWADGGLEVRPLRWLGSSDVLGLALASGYVALAPGSPVLPAGSEVTCELTGGSPT
jgi:molybdopterin molybdotransferase